MADQELLVRFERDDKLAIITLARKPINAYDDLFDYQLEQAWLRAARDDSRVVLLKAEGRHFCVGANLRGPGENAPATASERLTAPQLFALMRNLMKPTIAAVQGGCIGGGQRFVFPCDIIFCTQDAFFQDPLVAVGGIGGIGAHLHTWFYGPRLAKEMLYAGTRVPAERLYYMGMVNRLYPTIEALHEGVLGFAREVAEQNPVAIRQAKRASNITMDIMGMHYLNSRFEEFSDEVPLLHLERR